MSVAAIHFGSIVSVGDVDDGMTFQDIETFAREDKNGKSGSDSETFNQWLNMVLDSPTWDDIAKQYGAENVLDAFCRTLIGNRNNRMMKPPEDVADEMHDESDELRLTVTTPRSETIENQNKIPWAMQNLGIQDLGIQDDTGPGNTEPGANESDMTTSTSSEDNAFSPPEMLSMTLDGFRSCIQVSWGKRFAILDSGHMGIVPQHALVGDMVAIVLGCTMPLVLRLTNVMSAKFLGESYTHGVMAGDLMGGHVVETWILEYETGTTGTERYAESKDKITGRRDNFQAQWRIPHPLGSLPPSSDILRDAQAMGDSDDSRFTLVAEVSVGVHCYGSAVNRIHRRTLNDALLRFITISGVRFCRIAARINSMRGWFAGMQLSTSFD
ncbi:hypothetical protein EPUS_08120 [Endocarpon pusillum Z07020]|uniref:Uncharacterized protein n=1 Tax=Endocarpon pusillum (strain Z07020 / HMAS-L-300199) TaxID=1263415 RepID=U1G9B0_ENDPU|nr:uncharacterized protein EPUS_08120 [Endocarpon pusillum Z07020]ERF74072.1 hypothetical protein EPUS_08120 [Endocarpon pusillum Z07020]